MGDFRLTFWWPIPLPISPTQNGGTSMGGRCLELHMTLLFAAFLAGVLAGALLVLFIGWLAFKDGNGVRLPW